MLCLPTCSHETPDSLMVQAILPTLLTGLHEEALLYIIAPGMLHACISIWAI